MRDLRRTTDRSCAWPYPAPRPAHGCVLHRTSGPDVRCRTPGSVGRRRLVLPLLLQLVGLLLGLVYGLVGVLRRAVDGVEHQRVDPGVHEVVLLPRRDHDQVALLDVLLLPADLRLGGAADEGQDLVDLVHLLADLPARRDGHDHQLGVLTRPQHATEVGALLGDGGDREVLHGRCLSRSPRSTAGARPAGRHGRRLVISQVQGGGPRDPSGGGRLVTGRVEGSHCARQALHHGGRCTPEDTWTPSGTAPTAPTRRRPPASPRRRTPWRAVRTTTSSARAGPRPTGRGPPPTGVSRSARSSPGRAWTAGSPGSCPTVPTTRATASVTPRTPKGSCSTTRWGTCGRGGWPTRATTGSPTAKPSCSPRTRGSTALVPPPRRPRCTWSPTATSTATDPHPAPAWPDRPAMGKGGTEPRARAGTDQGGRR